MYRKTMRAALEEARQYKDPKGELLMLQEQDKNGHPIRSISLSVK